MKRKSQCSPKSSLVSSKKISSLAGSRRSKTTRATKPRKAPEAPDIPAAKTKSRDLTIEFMGSLLNFPRLPGDRRPAWARRASKEFWRALGLSPLSSPKQNTVGALLDIIAGPLPGGLETPDDLNLFPVGSTRNSGLMPSEPVKNSPSPDIINWVGRNLQWRLQHMPQRAWILCMMAAGWEAVQTMNSARQVYTWLQSIWIQGRPVIHPLTEYREVKNVCLLIGLQFPLRNKDRH
jgi:hypothetical protein